MNQNETVDVVQVSMRMRWLIWLSLFLLSISVGISEAVISASSMYIKKTLFIKAFHFSILEAMYNVGRIIGSFIFLFIFNIVNRKQLIVVPMFIKSASLIGFILTRNIYCLCALRTIAGCCLVFPLIYAPLWVDQYSAKNTRYLMLTWLMTSIPLGKGIGFGFNYFAYTSQWKLMIIIEAILLILITSGFIFFPLFYFSDRLVAVEETKDNTTFVRRSSKIVTVLPNLTTNTNTPTNANTPNNTKPVRTLCTKIIEVLCNKLFFFTTFARIVLLSLNSVLIFWLPSYIYEVLYISSRRERLFIYITILFCSPIIGGVLCHSITLSLDGYESQSAFITLLIINLISTCAFVAVPYVTEWYYFALFVIIYMIGINTIVPILNGIILTSMPLELKAISFTISELSNVFFGFGFSSPLYGLIYSYTKAHSKTFAMKCFTFSSIFSVFWLLLATVTRHIQDAQASKYRMSQTSKDKDSNMRLSDQSYNSSHVSLNMDNDMGGQLEFEYESDNSDADVILNLVDFK